VWDVFQERLIRSGLVSSKETSSQENLLKFNLELSDQDIEVYTGESYGRDLSHGVVYLTAWVESLESGGSRLMIESVVDAYVYKRQVGGSFEPFSNSRLRRSRLSSGSDYYIPITLTSNGILEYELLGYSSEQSIELSHVKRIQDEFTRIKQETARK